jgi:hypothetical protein
MALNEKYQHFSLRPSRPSEPRKVLHQASQGDTDNAE